MPKNHDIITLKLAVQHETDKAVMVQNLNDEKVWLPKSAIEIDEDDKEIQLPEWLAVDKELV